MRSSRPATRKFSSRRTQTGPFWLFTSLVILGNALLIASFSPVVARTTQHQADQLVITARHTTGDEARLNYAIAGLLDPTNPSAAIDVARRHLAHDQPEHARTVLKRATHRGAGEIRELTALQLQTTLELGRLQAALHQADQLVTNSAAPPHLHLAALTYAVGEREDLITRYNELLLTSEAARRVLALRTNKIALAQELFATGLVRSSQRLLEQQPHSYLRDFLLGQLHERQSNPAHLTAAREAYQAALSANPASLDARRGLVRVLASLDDQAALTQQTQLLRRLEQGQP